MGWLGDGFQKRAGKGKVKAGEMRRKRTLDHHVRSQHAD